MRCCTMTSMPPRIAGPIHAADTSIHGRRHSRTRTRYPHRESGATALVKVAAVTMRRCRRPFASAHAPFASSSLQGQCRASNAARMASAFARRSLTHFGGTGSTSRLRSLDVMRGLVMVLMAIDHVRVYSGQPAGGPTAGIFLTRWVTHFCAPAFVFFAGTGEFLYGRKLADTGALARYLVVRGLVLVLLELTVIRVAWTFNFDFAHYLLAGVIWMLGICMILLAGLVWLPTTAIVTFGLIVVFAQDIFGVLAQALPEWAAAFLYLGGVFTLGQDGPAVAVLYSLVPWIGVMAMGYAFGAIMIRESGERRRLCLRIGLSATALFVVVGGANVFLSSTPANASPTLFR